MDAEIVAILKDHKEWVWKWDENAETGIAECWATCVKCGGRLLHVHDDKGNALKTAVNAHVAAVLETNFADRVAKEALKALTDLRALIENGVSLPYFSPLALALLETAQSEAWHLGVDAERDFQHGGAPRIDPYKQKPHSLVDATLRDRAAEASADDPHHVTDGQTEAEEARSA